MSTLQPGLSLIELLVVIAIISLIGGLISPFLSNFLILNNLETTSDKIVGTLTKAQNYALDNRNNVTWGACVSGSNIRLFSGSCASPSFSENLDLPTSVTVSGFSEITFSARGEPSSTLTITLSSTTGSRTITLNSTGGLTVN